MNRRLRKTKKGTCFSRWIKAFVEKGKRQLTIMVAPHDVSKVVQMRVSMMSLWITLFLASGLLIGVIVFSFGWVKANRFVKQTDKELQQAQASMSVVRSDINLLKQRAEGLHQRVNNTLEHLGETNGALETSKGDLSSIQKLGTSQSPEGTIPESTTLKEVISIIDQIEPGLNTIYNNFEAQKEMFQDMPTRWPLGGGVHGYLTQRFGASRDPFTYEWQFHTGLDIAYSAGTPIVAAARGIVVKTDYDANGYGFYVVVQHRYGFRTLYGHMQRYAVRVGQELKQGDLIGYMGRTGRATGHHLHFEIRMGTEVLDPINYLTLISQTKQRPFKKGSKT